MIRNSGKSFRRLRHGRCQHTPWRAWRILTHGRTAVGLCIPLNAATSLREKRLPRRSQFSEGGGDGATGARMAPLRINSSTKAKRDGVHPTANRAPLAATTSSPPNWIRWVSRWTASAESPSAPGTRDSSGRIVVPAEDNTKKSAAWRHCHDDYLAAESRSATQK